MKSSIVELSKKEIDGVGGGIELSEAIGGILGFAVTLGGLYLLNCYLNGIVTKNK